MCVCVCWVWKKLHVQQKLVGPSKTPSSPLRWCLADCLCAAAAAYAALSNEAAHSHRYHRTLAHIRRTFTHTHRLEHSTLFALVYHSMLWLSATVVAASARHCSCCCCCNSCCCCTATLGKMQVIYITII